MNGVQNRYIYLSGFIFIIYTAGYLSHIALPGSYEFPLGWWGWFDQGQYLKSIQAIAEFNFERENYFYPPLYPMMGALFYNLAPVHPFFFINAFCFVLSALLFVAISRRYIGMLLAISLFALVAIYQYSVFEQYIIPWTTIPCTLILYVLIWLVQQERTNLKDCALFGLVAGLIVPIRPGDVLFTLPLALLMLINIIGSSRSDTNAVGSTRHFVAIRIAVLVSAGTVGIIFFFGFNKFVFGEYLGRYFSVATGNGFHLTDIVEKYISLFLDGYSLYGENESAILKQMPWIFFSIAGFIYVVLIGDLFLIAVGSMFLIQLCIYLPYADLIPNGFWRYKNVHYITWFLPMLSLYAILPFSKKFRKTNTRLIFLAFTIALILVSPSMELHSVNPNKTNILSNGNKIDINFTEATEIDGIDLYRFHGGWNETYHAQNHFVAGDGKVLNWMSDYRMLPTDYGLRLLFIRPITLKTLKVSFSEKDAIPSSPHYFIRPFSYRYAIGFPKWLKSGRKHLIVPYNLGETLTFSQDGHAVLYQGKGWSTAEPWGGTWTDGNEVDLQMILTVFPQNDLVLKATVSSFLSGQHHKLDVGIQVNGQLTGIWHFRDSDRTEIKLEIPKEIIKSDRILRITFSMDAPASPFELGLSNDTRKLGLGFYDIVILEQ